MSNPISNQAIPLSFDDQPPMPADEENQSEGAGNVDKYKLEVDDQSQSPVGHHVHKESEPLPGARGAAPTFDYSPEAIDRARIPPSELGYTPPAHPHAHNDPCGSPLHKHSPATFSSQEPLSGPTTEYQLPDQNPFVTPPSQTHHSHGAAPFIPPHVGTTENRGSNYDIDSQPKPTTDNKDSERTQPSFEDKDIRTAENKAPSRPTTDNKDSERTKPGFGDKDMGTTDNKASSDNTDGQPKPTAGDAVSELAKPSFGDKVIGATEKLAGKLTRNPELEEKGQLRGHSFEATKN